VDSLVTRAVLSLWVANLHTPYAFLDYHLDNVRFIFALSDNVKTGIHWGLDEMSDGPHRSLKLRKPWKELAKRADQDTYNASQIAEATTHAVASDFKMEVSWHLMEALKAVFTGRDNSLEMPELALDQLENAKALAAASVFGTNLVEWSITLIHEGKFGIEAFHEAVGLAAKDRCHANIRSIEEHYLRDSNEQRAEHVSNRLQNAISILSSIQLGLDLVGPEPTRILPPRKMEGLDDGVSL
jgi:hypothetical protein